MNTKTDDQAEKPLISIITAVRNSADGLETTLKSLINQTYQDFEHIIIDGCSTDGTRNIIHQYEKFITYWISEQDQGISDAWNKGLSVAKGNILAILNAGDYFAPDTLEQIISNLDQYSHTVTYGTTILINNEGVELKKVFGKFRPNNLAKGFGFYHPGCFFTRTTLEKVGKFKLHYRFAMDYDWLIRCHKANITFKKLDTVCYMPINGISHTYNFSAYGEYLQILADNGYSVSSVYYAMLIRSLRALLKIILS
jgi:glycosyltransferase involved in cell wall biosynthesis